MSASAAAELRRRWFPLCGLEDLPPRHVFETELLEQELIVWRSSTGQVNVWANRCPHRGMRLSLGANLGTTLRCAYHGYRFESGSGQCEAVPAHPDRAPPRSVCAAVFAMRERHGLIWTCLEPGSLTEPDRPHPAAPLPAVPAPAAAARVGGIALYALAIEASAAEVAAQLPGFRAIDAFSFEAHHTRLWLQPVSAACTIIHGRVFEDLAGEQRLQALRQHAEQFTALRAQLESARAAAHA